MKEEKTKKEDLPFEQALALLEEKVRRMETGNVPLEEMIRQYEDAQKLAAFCRKKLAEMKRRIEILTKETPSGGIWRDAEPEEEAPSQDDFFASGSAGRSDEA